ncbi:MAG: LysR family transcriptional regulator [Steroidobacteraceae bacterium]
MLPVNELAVFATVVDAGSFSAAARQLKLSKATVSEQVARLEKRLGARLLHRTTRRLSLTQAGEACYQHSARLVEAAESAARAAHGLHAEPRGLLRVSAPQAFAPMHVAPALPALLAQHPRLEIELQANARVVDLVQEKIDVAIRIGSLPDSMLVARRLGYERLIIVAAPEYLRRRGTPQRAADIERHDVVQFAPFGWGEYWLIDDPQGERRRMRVHPRLVCDSGEALVAAVRAGAGLVALPDWMVPQELATGALVQVLPGWGREAVPIHALHASGGQAAAKVRVFIDHLVRAYGGQPWVR